MNEPNPTKVWSSIEALTPPHYALMERTIIGPDRLWGSFVFTPLSGLVQEVALTNHVPASSFHNKEDRLISNPNPLNEDDLPLLTPIRNQRSLVFSSSKDMEKADINIEPSLVEPMVVVTRSSPVVTEFCDASFPEPPAISRVISHEFPIPLVESSSVDQEKFNILIQAVDYVTLEDSWKTGNLSQSQYRTLRRLRSNKLKPSWK